MTTTCPHCHATVLSTSQPMVILDRKRSDDLLRECGYEPKTAAPAGEEVILEQSEDMKGNWVQTVRLANGEEIVRKIPQCSATPAVGGEAREQIAKIVCCPDGCILATCGDDACVALNPEYVMLPTADAILAALSAAPPASPLRGGGNALVRALVDVLAYEQEAAKLKGFSDCTCMGRSRAAENAYEMGECPHQKARAALSASPPEQPAAETRQQKNEREMAEGSRCDGSCNDGLPCHCQPAAARAPMLADVAQIIQDGWKSGKSSADVAEEIFREFE